MCEVLGLCYFQLNTVVLFVVLRTMMRSITVSAKIGTDERSSVRYTSTQCNSLVRTLKFMQAKKQHSTDTNDTYFCLSQLKLV